MGITDQKPRIATEADIRSPWNGGKDGKYFRCYLCGHKFQVGDQYRFILSKAYTNFLVCAGCDCEDVERKWIALHLEWYKLKEGKFWHFIVPVEEGAKEELQESARIERDLQEDVKYWKDKATYPDSRD